MITDRSVRETHLGRSVIDAVWVTHIRCVAADCDDGRLRVLGKHGDGCLDQIEVACVDRIAGSSIMILSSFILIGPSAEPTHTHTHKHSLNTLVAKMDCSCAGVMSSKRHGRPSPALHTCDGNDSRKERD